MDIHGYTSTSYKQMRNSGFLNISDEMNFHRPVARRERGLPVGRPELRAFVGLLQRLQPRMELPRHHLSTGGAARAHVQSRSQGLGPLQLLRELRRQL